MNKSLGKKKLMSLYNLLPNIILYIRMKLLVGFGVESILIILDMYPTFIAK